MAPYEFKESTGYPFLLCPPRLKVENQRPGRPQIYVEEIFVLDYPAVRDLGSGPEYVAGQHESDDTVDR